MAKRSERLERGQAGWVGSGRHAVWSQSIGQESVGLALDVCSSEHLRQVVASLAWVGRDVHSRDGAPRHHDRAVDDSHGRD